MTNHPENPYLNGRQEWLERHGNYLQRAAHWRFMALGCLGVAAIAVAANVFMARQYKVVPYVVEVDRLGKASAVARADLASPVPERLIQAELAGFVVDWRTVTADLDLQQRMVGRLSFLTAGAAKGQLRQWFEAHNPYERAKQGKLVQVAVKGLPLPVSKDSWRVEWTETVRNHAGALMDEPQAWEATFAIQVQPPETDEQIVNNPGGIFVTGVSFSKILK